MLYNSLRMIDSNFRYNIETLCDTIKALLITLLYFFWCFILISVPIVLITIHLVLSYFIRDICYYVENDILLIITGCVIQNGISRMISGTVISLILIYIFTCLFLLPFQYLMILLSPFTLIVFFILYLITG